MAIAVMAAVIGMTSCAKDGGEQGGADNGKTSSVKLVLTEKTHSRAAAAPAAAASVSFKSGYVIFVNNVGVVNKVTEIVPGAYPGTPAQADIDAKTAGTKVWLNDMKAVDMGGEIKNVPDAATKVFIVGNLPSGVTAPTLTENISTIQNRVISLLSQSNDNGDLADATLYGEGQTLIAHPTVADTKYAKVEVNAITSRIEIGAISYSHSTNFVTSFQIDGIFLNHYYTEMSLASKVSTALTHNVPQDNTEADSWYATGSKYLAANLGKLFDYDQTNGLGFDVTAISKSAADPAVSSDKNVWAYNVLAPKSVDGTVVTALNAPHVVIRLSNLVTTGDTGSLPAEKIYPGTQYLTVKEFRKANDSSLLESFAPGYIYYITNLTFNEANLTDVPESATVTVYVEAELMSWTREEVEWGF